MSDRDNQSPVLANGFCARRIGSGTIAPGCRYSMVPSNQGSTGIVRTDHIDLRQTLDRFGSTRWIMNEPRHQRVITILLVKAKPALPSLSPPSLYSPHPSTYYLSPPLSSHLSRLLGGWVCLFMVWCVVGHTCSPHSGFCGKSLTRLNRPRRALALDRQLSLRRAPQTCGESAVDLMVA